MQVQLAYRCALVLKDLINPYLLRRQKKDIVEIQRMPGKTEQVLFCRLSPRQRFMYSAFLRSAEVQDVVEGKLRCFRAITILRKLCNHPDLVCRNDNNKILHFVRYGTSDLISSGGGKNGSWIGGEGDDDEEEEGGRGGTPAVGGKKVQQKDDEEDDDQNNEFSFVNRSGKLKILAKILPLWREQGHRVLIFSQTIQMLNLIERFVDNKGMNFRRMDGKTNVASRQHLVDSFNSDESIFGMLLTTKTGGVGVNLIGANRWEPASPKATS